MHTMREYIKTTLAKYSMRQEKIRVIAHILHFIKSSMASK